MRRYSRRRDGQSCHHQQHRVPSVRRGWRGRTLTDGDDIQRGHWHYTGCTGRAGDTHYGDKERQMFIIGLLIGLFIGATGGVVIVSLCVSAGSDAPDAEGSDADN